MLTLSAHAQLSPAAPFQPCAAGLLIPPTTPTMIFTFNRGTDGSGGPSSSFEGPGHAGTPGGPGATLTDSVTTPLSSIALLTQGGTGGNGSDAGSGNPAGSNGGGVGVTGGAGGDVTLTTSSPVVLQASSVGLLSNAVCAASVGGTGGEAGLPQNKGPRHPSGPGGNGGTVTVTITNEVASAIPGVVAWSLGGTGANGKSNTTAFGRYGGDAGPGGPGGSVTVIIPGTIMAGGVGVFAASGGGSGGTGGDNGSDGGTYWKAGNGGDGGAGGSVNVTLSGSIATGTVVSAPGILAESYGGLGGAGGGGGDSGAGGTGGTGGPVTINLGGTITTSTQQSAGVVAQSFGGQGAPGGSGTSGGAGGGGGDGGTVTVQSISGSITTGAAAAPTDDSPGILAQSVGGGGSWGGAASGVWTEIGGTGGVGAGGNQVTINLNMAIQTSGDRSQGILAQSIGGGGGTGGNADGSGTIYNQTVGGSGQGGGAGGPVNVFSGGIIATAGEQSPGLLVQSIGGGGGSGGAGYGSVMGKYFGLQISLGGNGAAGGAGGPIGLVDNESDTNAGVIWTSGSESTGILAQSIGGGGGKGGPSSATAISLHGNDGGYLSITESLGGSGGSGGAGSSVSIANGGLLLANGAGSRGIEAQSIGGGGGDGGDAKAVSNAGNEGFGITVQHTVGGSAGVGSDGGPVTLGNSGLIVTTGADGDAILAQSIGGGGGTSGTGDGRSTGAISVATTLGGAGGQGGDGGPAMITNSGAILTLGDGAAGLAAQSIGGGGGRVGGGAGNSGSSSFAAAVKVGGTGGNGSSLGGATTDAVTVTNNGPILTFGADAPGIIAQSIGGGGGNASKGASSLGTVKSTGDGGNGATTTASMLGSLAAEGTPALGSYQTLGDLTSLANQLLGNGTAASGTGGSSMLSALTGLSASAGSSSDAGAASSVTLDLNLGAAGGGGGNGGTVQVTNAGDIATTGKMSNGILAQSVGGGGGTGGVSSSAPSIGSLTASVTLGGGSGDGQAVIVQNLAGASVTTIGGAAPGIIAQSIGGGGGVGSVSGHSTALMPGLTVSLGGHGGLVGGVGGSVTVTDDGAVITLSHDSPGIIAQSIGGGGGLLKTLANDLDSGGGQVIDGGTYGIDFSLTGIGAIFPVVNPGGPVVVSVNGTVSTAGKNSYGIVAQSIGGGGGLVLGGTPNGTSFFGNGRMIGDAGPVTVTVGSSDGSASASIATTGLGGVAILAQSIGGGGVLAGDTGLTAQRAGFTPSSDQDGSGGPVTIIVNQNATVQTAAGNTPAILAQSIGGGGGRITNYGYGAYDGSAGGSGNGGTVTINVLGTVSALGAASQAIFAESTGQSGSTAPIAITVGSAANAAAVVSGGTDFNPGDGYGAGIYLVNGGLTAVTPNTLDNYGTVTSLKGDGGTGIYSSGGYTVVTNETGGTINGTINLNGSGACTGSPNCPAQAAPGTGRGDILNFGLIQSQSIRLGGGMLTNAGTLDVRAGGNGTVTLEGNYHAVAGSSLLVGADFAKGSADRLAVTGNVELDPHSKIRVAAANWQKGSVAVLTAGGTLLQDPPAAEAVNSAYLFGLQTAQTGNTLQVQTVSRLTSATPGLTANQQSVANSLDAIWHSAAVFDAGTAALAGVSGPQSYRVALTSLAGASVGGIVAAKQAASERFANRLIDCETYSGVPTEDSCAWLRVIGGRTTLSNSGDDPGYRQDTLTYQIGGQTEVRPGWFVGGSLGYESNWLTGDGDGSEVSGQSALFGAMLKHQTGPWVLSGVIDGGYGWYQSARQITVGTTSGVAQGSPNVAHAGLHLRAAYDMPLGAWYAKPYVTADAVYRDAMGYRETGPTAFNEIMQSSSDVVGGISPMLELGRGGNLAGLGTLRTYMAVGAAFYINNDWATRANFEVAPAGIGSFTTISRLPNTVGRIDVGADFLAVGNIEAKLTYGGSFASGYSEQSLVARLAYHF